MQFFLGILCLTSDQRANDLREEGLEGRRPGKGGAERRREGQVEGGKDEEEKCEEESGKMLVRDGRASNEMTMEEEE
ncbi:hypothetical protein E2C01_077607 [Portunus trituberculatus]|uniref:Uncharacterized protein n=1 Tax=Portunus trituberculatus TaxID=210409 RepID=A0A5B7IQ52_PORTR|nr:hypothetical protein [Portunus trituberculatus]